MVGPFPWRPQLHTIHSQGSSKPRQPQADDADTRKAGSQGTIKQRPSRAQAVHWKMVTLSVTDTERLLCLGFQTSTIFTGAMAKELPLHHLTLTPHRKDRIEYDKAALLLACKAHVCFDLLYLEMECMLSACEKKNSDVCIMYILYPYCV